MDNVALEVRNLKTYFPIRRGLFSKTVAYVRAVDDVSLQVQQGETLGLVGESGCGKTTLGRSVLGLVKPTSGEVVYRGTDLLRLSPRQLAELRKDMQIVFQDPYSSLNPRRTVAQMIGEVLTVVGQLSLDEAHDRLSSLLEQVGLSQQYAVRYPHEFSGGQRQRIAIARAIALNPSFLVCDEPVSALDVSIQSQVINLLIDIREQYGMTYLFISHDLKVVRHISDRVAVMYLGGVVELADTESLFNRPFHPYTKALLSAALTLDRERTQRRILLEGEIPSATSAPQGCRFAARCWKATDRCRNELPLLEEIEGGHLVSCFFPE